MEVFFLWQDVGRVKIPSHERRPKFVLHAEEDFSNLSLHNKQHRFWCMPQIIWPWDSCQRQQVSLKVFFYLLKLNTIIWKRLSFCNIYGSDSHSCFLLPIFSHWTHLQKSDVKTNLSYRYKILFAILIVL